MFIYLHGFNSAPASFKARLLHDRLAALGRADEFAVPELSHRPCEAVAAVERVLQACNPQSVTLVGSSLGGHYATWLAERHGLRAVLVNPAIRPHELLAPYLGLQTNLYTGVRYELTLQHLDELRALEVGQITRPERYLLLVAMADEVLDSRVAVGRFEHARRIVDPRGDHGFSDFARHVDAVIEFGDERAIDMRAH